MFLAHGASILGDYRLWPDVKPLLGLALAPLLAKFPQLCDGLTHPLGLQEQPGQGSAIEEIDCLTTNGSLS